MAKKPTPKMLGSGAAAKAARAGVKRRKTMADRMKSTGAASAMPSKRRKKSSY